jgi:hypothetical protein
MSRLDPRSKTRRLPVLTRTVLAVAAVGALSFAILSAGACGTSSGTGDTGGSDTTTTSLADSLTHPTGSDQIVLQVTNGGGFVPVEYNLTATPEFTLYGDGRVIISGPVIAIYPPPGLPNLQTAVIPGAAIDAILSAAQEAGLLQNDVDYGQPGITDVSTTSFVVNVGGIAYRSDVYALGMEAGAGSLSMEQQQARAAIQDLRGKLIDLTAFVAAIPTWSPYEYKSIAVFSRAVDPKATTDPTDVQPNKLDWPLADLSTLGTAVDPAGYRRAVISGQELTKLQPLLRDATAITLWTSGQTAYNLYFRPLLPDEKS